jgi:hypothetical protein
MNPIPIRSDTFNKASQWLMHSIMLAIAVLFRRSRDVFASCPFFRNHLANPPIPMYDPSPKR